LQVTLGWAHVKVQSDNVALEDDNCLASGVVSRSRSSTVNWTAFDGLDEVESSGVGENSHRGIDSSVAARNSEVDQSNVGFNVENQTEERTWSWGQQEVEGCGQTSQNSSGLRGSVQISDRGGKTGVGSNSDVGDRSGTIDVNRDVDVNTDVGGARDKGTGNRCVGDRISDGEEEVTLGRLEVEVEHAEFGSGEEEGEVGRVESGT